MNAVGRNLGYKIDWVMEVGVGEVVTALETNKFDVMCATLWPSPSRIKSLTMTKPVFYNAAYAYVRADDKRFDGDLNKANKQDVVLAGIDGDYTQDLNKEKLPLATENRLPQTASGSEMLLQVVSKKADIVFTPADTVFEFSKTNPNLLRRIEGIGPVRVYGEMMTMKNGETELKNQLDIAIEQLVNDGVIKQLTDKYRKEYNSTFYPPSPSFLVE